MSYYSEELNLIMLEIKYIELPTKTAGSKRLHSYTPEEVVRIVSDQLGCSPEIGKNLIATQVSLDNGDFGNRRRLIGRVGDKLVLLLPGKGEYPETQKSVYNFDVGTSVAITSEAGRKPKKSRVDNNCLLYTSPSPRD